MWWVGSFSHFFKLCCTYLISSCVVKISVGTLFDMALAKFMRTLCRVQCLLSADRDRGQLWWALALSSLSSALEIITRLCHHPFAKLFYWFPAGQWWLELAPLWFLWIFQWPRSGLVPPRSDHWQRKSHPLQESNYHQGAICGFNSLHIICSMVHWGQLNTTR